MTTPCNNCTHYHGVSYGHDTLHCAMYPYGPEGVECEDWEGGSSLNVGWDSDAVREAILRVTVATEGATQAFQQIGVAAENLAAVMSESLGPLVEEMEAKRDEFNREQRREELELQAELRDYTPGEVAMIFDEWLEGEEPKPLNFKQRVWADVVRMG